MQMGCVGRVTTERGDRSCVHIAGDLVSGDLALLLIDDPQEDDMLVGRSVVMQELRGQITRLSATQFTVLITGESGTGKELVARSLHAGSARHRGPFIAVNCAALVETLLE